MLTNLFLKRVVFVALAAVTILGAYTIFFVTPMYVNFFARHIETNLIRMASQMSTELSGKQEINKELSSDRKFIRDLVGKVMKAVDLWKVKVFAPNGEIVFSTDPTEVGGRTSKDFFPEILGGGDPRTAVFMEKVQSTNGSVEELTLVETYVPIIRDGRTIGIFEIYYDISVLKQDIGRLSLRVTALLLLVLVGLFAALLVVAMRASAGLAEREKTLKEKEQLEREVAELNKKEAIATLAGGVAHDFNNILTAVLGYVNLAKLKSDRHSELYQILEDANKSSLIAKDLTRQLMTITSTAPQAKKRLKAAQLISKSVPASQESSKVKLFFIIPDDLWEVEVDEKLFEQAIHSLIINADQAMPDGGTVTVRGRNVTIDNREMIALTPGRYVDIAIEDSGLGIADDQLDRIFDPYFTTKAKHSRRGLGLGLAFSYSVLKKHGGHISVSSKLGQGTTFHVYLPAAEKQDVLGVDI